MKRVVLFICTGNYYRSRFAEALFNFHARDRGLNWQAISRGLAVHLMTEGNLSPFTRAALLERGIDCEHTCSMRIALCTDDFSTADRIIALDAAEHRPMLRETHSQWLERVEFWDVADIPYESPDRALAEIERRVLDLFDSLREFSDYITSEN